jgi:hypothetical protein
MKHLEFIQNVILRMNNNSFLIKGWAITLISALFALASKDASRNYAMVSYIVIPVFWILDGFLISNERKFRALHKKVSLQSDDSIDFNMDTTSFNDKNRTWIMGIFSKTLILFYGISIVVTLFVMFLLK